MSADKRPAEQNAFTCIYNSQNTCPHQTKVHQLGNDETGVALAIFCLTCQACRIADYLRLGMMDD